MSRHNWLLDLGQILQCGILDNAAVDKILHSELGVWVLEYTNARQEFSCNKSAAAGLKLSQRCGIVASALPWTPFEFQQLLEAVGEMPRKTGLLSLGCGQKAEALAIACGADRFLLLLTPLKTACISAQTLDTILNRWPGFFWLQDQQGACLAINPSGSQFLFGLQEQSAYLAKTAADFQGDGSAVLQRLLRSDAVQLEPDVPSAQGTLHAHVLHFPLWNQSCQQFQSLLLGYPIDALNALQNFYQKLTGMADASHSSASEYLQEIQFFYDQLLNMIPMNVYWKAQAGDYRGCNQNMADFVNIGKNEIVGLFDKDLLGAVDSNTVELNDKRILETGVSLRLEENIVYKNTHRIYLSVKVPIYNMQGELIGLGGISMDVTDEKKLKKSLLEANHQLQRSNARQIDMMANVSHDFKTPISAILIGIDLLRNLIADQRQKRIIENIQKSAQSVLNLVTEFLYYAELNLNQRKFFGTDVFNLLEVIENVMFSMVIKSHDKNIDIFIEYPKDMPYIFVGHRFAIERIVSNYLSNALKYTSVGYVCIQAKLLHVQHDVFHIELRVIDSGIGLKIADPSKLFRQFYRIGNSKALDSNSSGIGLSIVKQFAESLDGEVGVDTQLEVGSQFWVRLPLKQPNKNQLDTFLKNQSGTQTVLLEAQDNTHDEWNWHQLFQDIAIWVVDDFPMRAHALSHAFKGNVTCLTSDECMEQLQQTVSKPHLILVDYSVLPHIRHVLENLDLMQTLVVILTPPQMMTEQSESNVWVWLEKPMARTALLKELAIALEDAGVC